MSRTVYMGMAATMFFYPAPLPAGHGGLGGHGGHGVHQATELDTIVVIGQRLDEYISDHPQLVTVLGRSAIEDGNYLDLNEAIDSMPGVDVSQSGSTMQSRISIQGSSGSGSIQVLINGRPANSSQYGSMELAGLPIDTVRRVTVFKPPVPVWLGPGGTAGAINIETRDSSREKGEWHSQVKGNAGSYGRVGGSAGYSSKSKDRGLMVTGGGSHRDGKRTNSDKDNGHLSLHWDRTGSDKSFFSLDGRVYYSEHGVSGPTYNPTPNARQRYSKAGLDGQFKGFNDYGDYSLKAFTDVVRLKDDLQDGSSSSLDTWKMGMKTEQVLVAAEGGWALRLGGLAQHEDVDHTVSGNHDRQQLSVHSQLDKELDDFSLSAGLRGDYVSDFSLFPAGSAGISYRLSDDSLLKINSGYQVKIPTFGQLYQPSHGSMDHARGNPDLDEEHVWSYSLNFEQSLGDNRQLQASLFYSNHSDLIGYQRGIDNISRPLNVDDAYRQGLELTLKYELIERLVLDMSYIIQESEIGSTGRELSYAPRHKGKIIIKYTLAPWQTRLETTVKIVSDQYSDLENTESEKLDSYTTIDFKAGQPFSLAGFKAEAYTTINNLTDTDYAVHYGYPDDGLRALLGLTIKF